MPETTFSPEVERLLRTVIRRLPRSHRAHHERVWRTEMHYMETVAEQFDYIRDLQGRLPTLLRELDPEWTYMRQAFRGAAISIFGCFWLSSLGVAPTLLPVLTLTIAAGLGVFVFSHLTTKGVLVMREVRRVWWRLGLNLLLTLFCGYLTLIDLTGWSVLHPQAFLMMVFALILGVRTARRFHQPRPALTR